jgi:DNA-binding PadR family transcriptional regulator
MKKQIKKLVKKTYLYDNYERVEGRQQKIYGFTEEGLEKFAELIVKECIALCQEVHDGGCGSAEDCVEELKDHFGKVHFGEVE